MSAAHHGKLHAHGTSTHRTAASCQHTGQQHHVCTAPSAVLHVLAGWSNLLCKAAAPMLSLAALWGCNFSTTSCGKQRSTSGSSGNSYLGAGHWPDSAWCSCPNHLYNGHREVCFPTQLLQQGSIASSTVSCVQQAHTHGACCESCIQPSLPSLRSSAA